MATGKSSVNKVIIVGRLGRDPELRKTPNDVAVTMLDLATNEMWKDGDGNKQEHTEWHRVVLWQRLAEIACEYLKKGSKIYVEGSLRTRSWEDKDGIKCYTTEVIADRLTLLDAKPEDVVGTEAGAGSSTRAKQVAGSGQLNDLSPPCLRQKRFPFTELILRKRDFL